MMEPTIFLLVGITAKGEEKNIASYFESSLADKECRRLEQKNEDAVRLFGKKTEFVSFDVYRVPLVVNPVEEAHIHGFDSPLPTFEIEKTNSTNFDSKRLVISNSCDALKIEIEKEKIWISHRCAISLGKYLLGVTK